MRSAILLTFGAALTVSAQNFSSCCNVTPASVNINDRLSWCRAQRNTCPLICPNGQTSKNDCDENTLSYACECTSGGTANISDYSQTLPSLECDEWVKQCVAQAPDNKVGQDFCHSFKCGSQNASQVGAGASSGASSPSSTSGGNTASSTSGTTGSTSSGAAVALTKVGRDYGSGALLVGVLAVFGFAL